MAGKLSIVATPIGNRGDITRRALETLECADAVCAEDTRVTGSLLAHYGISARLERCDENVISQRSASLVERMAQGEHIAFCSDAGMPGVSDPGLVLVDAAREAGIRVEVLPGASAVPCAIAAAGFNGTAFYFGGFLPRKQSAQLRLLESLESLDATLVFYESPHRVARSVQTIAQAYGERVVALCRELTKLHEEVLRLPAPQLACELQGRQGIKGEIALVIAPPGHGDQGPRELPGEGEVSSLVGDLLEQGLPASKAARQLARELGIPKAQAYDLVLQHDGRARE